MATIIARAHQSRPSSAWGGCSTIRRGVTTTCPGAEVVGYRFECTREERSSRARHARILKDAGVSEEEFFAAY